ncbi:hypothetical protein [Aquabacterium sp.]|uniref:hypothetical protein n=1 Tax=Aquabacterium sp. TaxID=1872578 RepID=UPI0035B3C916
MSALERRMKEADAYADGGVVRTISDAVRPFSESVGGYWSNSNKEFEATNPGVGERFGRALNPVTGFGSAVGAMYDAAGNGSARDAAIAAAQAAPMFASMKALPAAKSLIPTAPQIAVATGKTAAKAAGGTGAGVAADEVQARGFANGGLVRGPGTGTSDDVKDSVREGTYIMPADSTKEIGAGALAKLSKVPVKLSNGEYKLTPEQVHAIGVQTLDGMKDATHEPVRKAYADGGLVEDEQSKVSQPVPGVQRQGNSYSATTVADRARQPAVGMGSGTYTPKPSAPAPQQTAPAATTSSQVVRQGNSFSAAPSAPRPASTSAPNAASAMSAMPAPQSSTGSQAWDSSDTAKAVGLGGAAAAYGAAKTIAPVANAFGQSAGSLALDIAKTAKGTEIPGMPKSGLGKLGALGALASTASDVWSTPTEDYRTRFGMSTKDPSLAGDLVARSLGAASDLGNTLTLGLAGKHLFRDKIDPANGQTTHPTPAAQALGTIPAAVPAQAAANIQASQTANGLETIQKTIGPDGRVTYRGTDIKGNASINGGAGRGGVSYVGDGSSAADVMARYARESDSLSGKADAQRKLDAYGPGAHGGSGVAGFNTGQGGRASAQQFQQDMLRTSLVQQAQKGGRNAAAAMQALNGMDGTQAQRDIAEMREQGDTNRFNTREAGETTRAGMRNAADARRDGISAAVALGKLDLDRQAQGFANRSSARQEKLYADYDAAKTPEERAIIAQKIRDLSGKEQSSDWQLQVTPSTKNLDGSTTEGSVYRYNKRTGDVQRVDSHQSATMPKVGEVRGGYKFKGGNPADQNSWESV